MRGMKRGGFENGHRGPRQGGRALSPGAKTKRQLGEPPAHEAACDACMPLCPRYLRDCATVSIRLARAPSVGSLPVRRVARTRLLPLSRVRKTPSDACRQTDSSTRSVLLPESLRVCPFGGAACLSINERRPRALPTRADECTRARMGCQFGQIAVA
ncbi:conserved hypothetical protein [Burkholderia mallei PRL-20]|nr:hypothetical protein BMA10247_3062 [Burkholderia mallei NCTC 10247]EDK84617.1 hypothetical protein BMA721280_E0216 [Burkholderia mallei 2002721280]EEP87817.1 conserved hypothetical protein [Burkholderia mallei GB8 horse 4]EES46086.1 conserved hypothetical protein [Burkholderia mallei PRL-20]KOS91193.1 hypothetical protein DM53_4369 [Burkholderia mallei]